MFLKSKVGRIGILLSLIMTFFLVSDAAAQCVCDDSYVRTSVRRQAVNVRHTARKYKPARSYRARTRTVYQPVYVPVRSESYPARYVSYSDADCDDVDVSRVYVTERVYTNGYNGNGVYVNGYNGNGRYVNGYSNKRMYTNGYGNMEVDADYYETTRIARDYGYKDGFIDGRDAGMERDNYNPENSGDYQKATNGYEDDFGDKHVYREAYRSSYLTGYRAGFRSIANRSTYRAAVNW